MMSRIVCMIVLVTLFSVSVSAQSYNFTVFQNSVTCNSTQVDANQAVANATFNLVQNVCTNITNTDFFVSSLFFTASCNSSTGVVSVSLYNEKNCSTVNATFTSFTSAAKCSNVFDNGHSVFIPSCPIVAPVTAAPTTVAPTNNGTNGTTAPTAAPTNPPTKSPQNGGASHFSLFAACAAIVVLATL